MPPLARWHSTQSLLTLEFVEPIRASQQLRLAFRTRTYANAHRFRTALFSQSSDKPLNAVENRNLDPQSAVPYSWTVLTTTAADRSLRQVKAQAGRVYAKRRRHQRRHCNRICPG